MPARGRTRFNLFCQGSGDSHAPSSAAQKEHVTLIAIESMMNFGDERIESDSVSGSVIPETPEPSPSQRAIARTEKNNAATRRIAKAVKTVHTRGGRGV